jgi:hypothetical protein
MTFQDLTGSRIDDEQVLSVARLRRGGRCHQDECHHPTRCKLKDHHPPRPAYP